MISNNTKKSDPDQDIIVNEICQQKMCEWSYRIILVLIGNRELVAVAQNYIDGFLAQYQWYVVEK
jgi:hypothetical protein